jgi:hypothetical protein
MLFLFTQNNKAVESQRLLVETYDEHAQTLEARKNR